jgi:hypothetical protein
MSDLWDRQPGESLLWYRRFERYRLMEPVRSINAVYGEENGTKQDEKERPKAPGKWYETAKKWQWDARAAAWDVTQDEQTERAITAERKKVLRTQYALMHKRVELLNRKAEQLAGITDTPDEIWVPDVKQIGYGEFAERVDLKIFNDAAFRELREYLDDIAAELGERVKKSETTIKSLPKVYIDLDPDEDGSEP